MSTNAAWRLITGCGLLLIGALGSTNVWPHGGVVREEDQCTIKIGYLEAHFKIYLPETRGQEPFCEDLPSGGVSVFVMEYLHNGLSALPIDFRIIRNVTGLGRFAAAPDIARIDDLEAATVYHQPADVAPGGFLAGYTFARNGEYIGIVTVADSSSGETYQAVFPFRVGFNGFGFWPWLILFILFLAALVWRVGRSLAG